MTISVSPNSFNSALSSTFTSTGTAADGGWQRWWREQSRLDGTDWESLLDQHVRVLQQLRQHVGLSS